MQNPVRVDNRRSSLPLSARPFPRPPPLSLSAATAVASSCTERACGMRCLWSTSQRTDSARCSVLPCCRRAGAARGPELLMDQEVLVLSSPQPHLLLLHDGPRQHRQRRRHLFDDPLLKGHSMASARGAPGHHQQHARQRPRMGLCTGVGSQLGTRPSALTLSSSAAPGSMHRRHGGRALQLAAACGGRRADLRHSCGELTAARHQ